MEDGKWLKDRRIDWLVGSLGLMALWDSVSVYIESSSIEREKEKRNDRRVEKIIQTTPTRTYCKHSRPLPCYYPVSRLPVLKITQQHRLQIERSYFIRNKQNVSVRQSWCLRATAVHQLHWSNGTTSCLSWKRNMKLNAILHMSKICNIKRSTSVTHNHDILFLQYLLKFGNGCIFSFCFFLFFNNYFSCSNYEDQVTWFEWKVNKMTHSRKMWILFVFLGNFGIILCL